MDEITKTGSKMEPRKLDSIIIPLPEIRYAIAEYMKSGQEEMDLESFLRMVQKVYRESK